MNKDIEMYINEFNGEAKSKLIEMYTIIKEVVPKEATEKISWRMPTFYLNGNLVHFAGFKNHIGLFPGADGIEKFKDKLYEYKLLNDMNTSLFIQKFINLYLNKYNIIEDITNKISIYKDNINKIKKALLKESKDIIFSDIKGGCYMTATRSNLSNNPYIYKKSYYNEKGEDIIRINITDSNIDAIANSIKKDKK